MKMEQIFNVVNSVSKQVLGSESIAVVDTSSFVATVATSSDFPVALSPIILVILRLTTKSYCSLFEFNRN